MTSEEPRLRNEAGEEAALINLSAVGEAERIARDGHNGLLGVLEKLQRECK